MRHDDIVRLDIAYDDDLLTQIAKAAVVITSDGIVIKDRREALDGPVPRVAHKRELDNARRAA